MAQIVLIAALGAQLTLRSRSLERGSPASPKRVEAGPTAARFSGFLRPLFLLSIVFVFGASIYIAISQYQIWQQNDLTKLLLPPYRGIDYFFSYAGTRFFSPWLISLLAAIVIPRVAERLNKKHGERFFREEEFGLMRLGLFLTGYPGFLFYLIFVLSAGVLLSTLYSLLSRGRAPLYWLWVPLAIATVVLATWFLPAEVLGRFAL